MAVQGHPQLLILAQIESVYATSYWLSIVTLVLYCPVSDILQVFLLKTATPPLFHLILRVFTLDWIADFGNNYLCTFEVKTYMARNHQRFRRTDTRTDGQLTIAIPRFAVRATRLNNEMASENEASLETDQDGLNEEIKS